MSGRIFYASLMTETNSFSNIPTGYASFERQGIRRGNDALRGADGAPRAGVKPLIEFARARDLQVVAGIEADACPGAPVPQHDYELLRDEILSRLDEALPVDAVFLFLHGAMLASACVDCEGDLLAKIRQRVGPQTPIGAVLDPHAHLTDAMLENSSALVFMKEYPHTDGAERSVECLRIIGGMLDGAVRPTVAVADCRWVGFFPTPDEPMRGFVEALKATELEPGVLSASFVHGFPWGDTPDTGAKILVYTDDDPSLASRCAEVLRERVWSLRHRLVPNMTTVAAAVRRAQQHAGLRPLVLADVSDNPGGGAPSDSTYILRAVLEQGLRDVAIGMLFDPELTRTCHEAGVGAVFDARIGGKISRYSGEPVDLEVTVRALARNATMDVLGLAQFPLGDTAWIEGRGVSIALSSVRTQMYAPSGFTHLGIDLAQYRTIVVKSSNHFRAAFAEVAGDVEFVSTPGALDFDFARLPYRAFRRPYYPKVANPHAT